MRAPRLLFVAVVSSLVLAGCSGSGRDSAPAGPPAEVVSGEPAPPPPGGGASAAPTGAVLPDATSAPAGSGAGAAGPGAAAPPGGASGNGASGGVAAKGVTGPRAAVGGGTGSAAPAVLKLGGVFPLSGPLGSVGTAMMEGVQSVLSEVNAQGGVNGSTLQLVVADDQFDPVRGKALIQKLIETDKVFAFAGIFSPFTTQAALPVIRAAGVPVVSPSGSDDREFDEPMLFPVTNPCGRQMAGNVAHLVTERKLTKLAVVYLNVEAVSNCTKQFTAVAQRLGADVVFSGATAPAAPDCASRVVAARASGAQALIVITDNLGTVKCLQARAQQGWDVPVSISYNNTDDPTILRGLGPAAEGLLSSSPFTGAASPAFAQQCGAIHTYYPESKVQFFSLVGCVGTKLLVAGLRAGGPTRTGLISALESGRTFSFGDLVPPLRYGPGRHLPYDLTATVEVRGGKWVRVGPLYSPAGAEPSLTPVTQRQVNSPHLAAVLPRRAAGGAA